MSAGLTDSDAEHHEPARFPRRTIRLRYGRKTLRHGLALGWRTEYPEQFPVTITRHDEPADDHPATCAR